MELVRRTTIARPAAHVWAVLADFGRISRWAPNVDHSCLMSEQLEGLGAVRRIQSGRNTVVEEVVEWEPGERLGYTIAGLPPVFHRVTNTWALAEEFGVTAVSLTTVIKTGPRPPHKVAARGVGQVLGKASDQMLKGLNDHLKVVHA